jgi:hypothetical protein
MNQNHSYDQIEKAIASDRLEIRRLQQKEASSNDATANAQIQKQIKALEQYQNALKERLELGE